MMPSVGYQENNCTVVYGGMKYHFRTWPEADAFDDFTTFLDSSHTDIYLEFFKLFLKDLEDNFYPKYQEYEGKIYVRYLPIRKVKLL
jgi:hypothetical protein